MSHNNVVDLTLFVWHLCNIALFGLTISPALETAEAIVKIFSGIIVAISSLVALVITINKNKPQKRVFKRKTRKP